MAPSFRTRLRRSQVPVRSLVKGSVFTAISLVLLLNYLIIFHGTYFSSLRQQIFSDASFHPPPFLPHKSPSPKEGDQDYWLWKTKTAFTAPPETKEKNGCATFPTHLLEKIQIVLKTGAADDQDRTDSQLESVVKCIPNILIASDLVHPFGPDHNATDVLASLPPQDYLQPDDLEIYLKQKQSKIEDLHINPEGWRLDRYKFLAEVEEAVNAKPNAEWYVFFEADTYIVWDNMFRLLANYDYQLPWYFGSPSPGRTVSDLEHEGEEKKLWFGYGGTGFVLSGVAAHRLVDRKRNAVGIQAPRVTEEYKGDVQNDCCGDSVLGWALRDRAGVDLSGLWPMFNPHGLHDIPFGKPYWCVPVISLHKSHPEDFKKLWEWENKRDRTQGPVLYRDLLHFNRLFSAKTRENWNNADLDGFNEEDPNHKSNQSFESCKEYCHEHEKCFQFTWHGHHCWMSSVIRVGHHKDPDGEHEEADRKYVSGWDIEKIRIFMGKNTCKDGAYWMKPSVERHF